VFFIKWISLEASYHTLPFNAQCLLHAPNDLKSKMCVLLGAFCVIIAARNLMNPGHILSTTLQSILILSSYLWFAVVVSVLQVFCANFECIFRLPCFVLLTWHPPWLDHRYSVFQNYLTAGRSWAWNVQTESKMGLENNIAKWSKLKLFSHRYFPRVAIRHMNYIFA